MEKTLSLYRLVDGQAVPFPNAADQIVLSAFSATYQRMGAAPYITATIKHPSCLDGQWDGVFVVFRNERFFVRNEPGSEKDTTDVRYTHTVTFQAERAALDEVYMIDAVQQDGGIDGYKSNDVKVQFMGDIEQWAGRLNDAFAYTGLYDTETGEGYRAVVDAGITSEDKLVSFEEKFISEALQEGFKVFDIPYYFVGKTIHFGYTENVISDPVEYGSDKALVSVGRANANIKLANRMSGYGSSDNIPYYYPNPTPLGDVRLSVNSTAVVSIRSTERLSMRIGHFPLHFGWRASDVGNQIAEGVLNEYEETRQVINTEYGFNGGVIDVPFEQTFAIESATTALVSVTPSTDWKIWFYDYDHSIFTVNNPVERYNPHVDRIVRIVAKNLSTGAEYSVGETAVLPAGEYRVTARVHVALDAPCWNQAFLKANVTMHYAVQTGVWQNNNDYPVDLYDLGLNSSGQATVGDTIALEVDHRIEVLGRLMPPIYRESGGKERFYNAINNTYPHPDGGYYVFENEYSDNNRRELIQAFEDIKPTITGVKNRAGQRIDKFLAFAWDTGDNDEYDEEGNYLHPYFFAKLAKTDGDYGFNLFDCASDSAMTVSFTSGTCGACKFEIGVDKDTRKNPVQVDLNGNLLRDSYGDVRCGRDGKPREAFLDNQQDTSNNAVWIALKKDNTTYPAIMPSYRRNLKPTTDDTFVLLNIIMPYAYILAAEDRLEAAIIDYMARVNSPLFNPSISFSRIFFEEEPAFLEALNENARLSVKYNNIARFYYISTFTYTMSTGEILPEVTVDLIEELTTASNSLQTKLDALKEDVLSSFGSRDVLRQTLPYFLRKDAEDTAKESIAFQKGATFGKFTEGELGGGGAIRVTEDGGTAAEFDYLKVRRKATFAELVVDKEQAAEGNVVITPAGVVLTKVEETADSFRCYFQKTDNDGAIVYNPFAENDLARCQTFNLVDNKYYWRKVIGVGADYIDLSKAPGEYDGTDSPAAGDSVIQLGNTTDTDRQSAIAISSYGTNSPSLKMYHGIDSFSLAEKDMFGVEYDAATGYPRFYNYGAMRLGARPDEQGGYIIYDHEAKTLNISAIVNFLAGSTGLADLPEYKQLVAIANGNIENWFYDNAPGTSQEGAPTMSNYPVNTWETGAYENHVGDIYYDDKGQGYRFKRISADTYGWQVLENQELSYLTAALEQSTSVIGGLILTSEINLGYKDADNVYHIMSGISGMGSDPAAIAAWYGGTKDSAKSLFRFDGTGFLAGGNIAWDGNGYGWVGGSGVGQDYAVKWDADGIHLGGGITLGASDKDVQTLLEYMSYFEVVSIPGVGNALKLNPDRFAGFFSEGFISANGASLGNGGGGGASTLYELSDVNNNGSAVTRLDGTAAQNGDVFVYSTTLNKWYAVPQSSISPDLTDYATKVWVNDQGFLKEHQSLAAYAKTAWVTSQLLNYMAKADLLENGLIKSSLLPSFVDDVIEADSKSAFPATGESGKIYVAKDTNKTYRWGGSGYVEISESLALGETSGTAYEGSKGKANADAIAAIQQTLASGVVSSVGGKTGAITLRGGQTANGSVNLTITSAKQIQAAIVGLATVATSGSYNDLLNKPTIPTKLPNPNALTFGSKTYDGSAAKEITKADLGLGNVENKSAAQILAGLTEQFIYNLLSTSRKNALDSGATEVLIRQITTNKNNIAGLTTRMGTAETDIDSLEERMDTAEGGIDSAEENITSLQTELTRVAGLADKFESWFGFDASKNMLYIKPGAGSSGAPADRGLFAYGAVSAGGASTNTGGGGGESEGIPHVFLTEAEYEALEIKDPGTLYFTYEEE